MPLILLIIGVVLIVYNYRAIRHEQEDKQDDSEFDISFQSVLQDSKEEMNDYKIELGLLRKDMAESLTELQEEIFDIKKDINLLEKDMHLLKNENSHLLKNENSQRFSHLLKNQDHILKNNDEVYENKEELENNYPIGESKIDNSIKETNKILEQHKDFTEVDYIDHETDEGMNLYSETSDGVISEIDFSVKADSDKTASIKKLLGEGLTEEQICHELSVSKGEVLLVKGLFKK